MTKAISAPFMIDYDLCPIWKRGGKVIKGIKGPRQWKSLREGWNNWRNEFQRIIRKSIKSALLNQSSQ